MAVGRQYKTSKYRRIANMSRQNSIMCGCRSPVYRHVWLSVASMCRQNSVTCGCRSPVYRHVWLSVASIPSCVAVVRQHKPSKYRQGMVVGCQRVPSKCRHNSMAVGRCMESKDIGLRSIKIGTGCVGTAVTRNGNKFAFVPYPANLS